MAANQTLLDMITRNDSEMFPTATETGTDADTLNASAGIITTASLTKAQNIADTRTLTNSRISTTSRVLVFVVGGTNTAPVYAVCTAVAAGSATIVLLSPLGAGISGTVKYLFIVF